MKKSVLLLVAGIIALILILYAINVFPLPGTDSYVFIPTALLFSRGQGLANPLYYIANFTDATHTFRFNYYVPFYPWFLGLLSKIAPGLKTIFFFCSLFSAVNLFLYVHTISSYIQDNMKAWAKLALILSTSYVAIYLLPTVGRPEGITNLMVFLVYLLYQKRNTVNSIAYNMAICLLFALMLASQLSCFYFCFLFFIAYELINTKYLLQTIFHNTARFVAILALFCIVLMITPNGLFNTLSGIKIHIGLVLDRNDRSIPLFIYYWLLAPLNTGFLILFIMGGVFYFKEIKRRAKHLQLINLVLVIGINALLILGLAKFVLYAGPAVYNATQFILPILCYNILNITAIPGLYQRRVVTYVSIVAYAAGTLIFLRSVLLFADYLQDGKTYDNAKEIVAKTAKGSKNVCVTEALWSLFDDPYQAKLYDGLNCKSGDTIIVQQVSMPFPDEFVGKTTVILNWTTADERKFLGIPLTKRPQGYSFTMCTIN